MDGKALAARIRADVAAEVEELGALRLATVLVGDDPASHVYITLKHDAARAAGIEAVDQRLPEDTPQSDVLDAVVALNDDHTVDGILVQSPLPPQIDEPRVMSTIAPIKDVDGLHPANAGRLFLGRPTFVPATPLGVMTLLEEYEVDLTGARAVVIGRSELVGKPVAQLLLQANATVTMCHTRTADLAAETRTADVLVVAAGRPGLVSPDMVKPGSVVVDVGISRTAEGLLGDVDSGAAEHASLLSPVPGGVGPMTISMLLQNTVLAARYRRGVLPFDSGGA
jgi:methylenetetrahydrofolate dehydrogenase (NADP+) / methenyltetrahydrofolate cyclohydrolase